MKRMLLLVTVAAMMAMMMSLEAGSALAVGLHQHQLSTPGEGDPQVAKGFCNENASAPHAAFENFHFNVHKGAPEDAFKNNPEVGMTVVQPNPC